MNALFVCTETVTPACYRGFDKHRLVTNVIFRMGAAAMLLSNKRSMIPHAKYQLQHIVRVHTAASDAGYK